MPVSSWVNFYQEKSDLGIAFKQAILIFGFFEKIVMDKSKLFYPSLLSFIKI